MRSRLIRALRVRIARESHISMGPSIFFDGLFSFEGGACSSSFIYLLNQGVEDAGGGTDEVVAAVV